MKVDKSKKIKRSQKAKLPKQLIPEITKDMTFAEVARKYPETHSIFFSMGMHCLGCPMAMQETIEQGAIAHGENVEKLLKKLNDAIKKKKRKNEVNESEKIMRSISLALN